MYGSWENESQELPFRDLIRRTLMHEYRAVNPDYPYVRLVGPDSEQGYELQEETIDRYGWLIRGCAPIINYGSQPAENTHHWYFVGNAVDEELKRVFSSAGLENVFMAFWDGDITAKCLDHHGFVYDYNRPAVNILTSNFTLDYVPNRDQPDWARFEDGIKSYVAMLNLCHADD